MSAFRTKVEQDLQDSLYYIRKHTIQQPRLGLILGSGLGDFADTLGNIDRIPTEKIPHYPKSTVEGHKGFLVFGKVENVPVLAVQGRTHYVELIEKTALELQIPLRKGVLFVSSGPSYESVAEIKMVQKLGGDAVSMSTVPEVITARARGIKVAGISCITNPATGLSQKPLSHEEVTEIASQVKTKFQKLVREIILRIDRLAS
jgi:purine nucleoside phosphorylase